MITNIRDASIYTDLNGLNAISQLGRKDSAEGLREVAKQFEAMFLNMMLKGMRAGEETLFGDNYLRSNETNFHQENFDNQLALHMSASGGVGLAETLHRQLMQRYEPANAVATAPTVAAEDNLNNLRRFTGLRPAVVSPTANNQIQAELVPISEWRARTVEVRSVAPFVELADQNHTVVPVTPARFESPEAFVEHLLPVAEKFAAELGVDPRVMLAQSALETGWGKKMITGADGQPSYNLFGIKANADWKGSRANVSTLEFRDGAMHREIASFRAYNSFEESFADYVRLIQDQPRYAKALQNASDSTAYSNHLQRAGYATDPDYAEKIQSVLRSPSLKQASLGARSATWVN
ncbi:MAG: flagellar assembly peptidoglycan hydrolase FlgJ [Pseudohongiella sp.]|nr:flagellar assembly peptidoglycan hydrolase FlgJ [Pseudohongiella sp.]